MEEKKSLAYIVVVVIVVAVIGWLFVSGKDSSDRMIEEDSAYSSDETSDNPKLAPSLQLTKEEKSGNISGKKIEIMARVNSGTPLIQEEKSEIAGILLTKGEVYNFSESERQAIYAALSKK